MNQQISSLVLIIQDKQVMLDYDLAKLYGVTTKALNQALKRNRGRFPQDFVFQINQKEKDELVTNCDRLIQNKKLHHGIHAEPNCDWDLIRQIRRAMISVGLNIAEGYSRIHIKEKEQFLNISITSLQEVQACLLIIRSREPQKTYVNEIQEISASL